MKRINVRYGATDYSIGGRDLADVQREIAEGVASKGIFWLEVNEGSGGSSGRRWPSRSVRRSP